jgi:DNA-binding response OmpR family regulator
MEETYAVETVMATLKTPINVLLVEDDPDSAELTTAQLSEGKLQGIFKIEWTDKLTTAMTRLAKPGVDVVLLDLGMPELSGYRSHVAIMSVVGKKIPVVILTSDDNGVSRHVAIGRGAANYLIKRRASPVEIRMALHDAVLESNGQLARFSLHTGSGTWTPI